MNVNEKIREYLNGDAQAMQLATVRDGQPWICTVYYVADDEMNLYWLSLPTRRHSEEIADHNKVAAAIAIKLDQPIIGIQVEGVAEEVSDRQVIKNVMKDYVAKYGNGKAFYDNFIAGKNKHHLYRLKPAEYALFDEVNYPSEGKQLWCP